MISEFAIVLVAPHVDGNDFMIWQGTREVTHALQRYNLLMHLSPSELKETREKIEEEGTIFFVEYILVQLGGGE